MATIVVRPDEELINADWTKQTWDLPFEPDSPEQAAYCEALGISEDAFRRLPVYQHYLRSQGLSNAGRD